MDGINELLHISKYYHITGVKIYYCVYVCGGGDENIDGTFLWLFLWVATNCIPW